jgi:hypothetical protein
MCVHRVDPRGETLQSLVKSVPHITVIISLPYRHDTIFHRGFDHGEQHIKEGRRPSLASRCTHDELKDALLQSPLQTCILPPRSETVHETCFLHMDVERSIHTHLQENVHTQRVYWDDKRCPFTTCHGLHCLYLFSLFFLSESLDINAIFFFHHDHIPSLAFVSGLLRATKHSSDGRPISFLSSIDIRALHTGHSGLKLCFTFCCVKI